MHEASQYKQNAFVTLTYSEENIPARGQLVYDDYQKFMKRLRKQTAPNRVRFYMCGEYGEQNWRPHFHACLFNHDWEDKKYWFTTQSGEKIYRSETLEQLWPHGHSSTASVTFESAAYVARYCLKKITGDNAEQHYKRTDEQGDYKLEPEFSHMSLKPGIGATWLAKYTNDVYNNDYVIINGKEAKPPKYYDKLYTRTNPDEFDQLRELRITEAMKRWEDNTDERLKVKEQVTEAKLKQLYRTQI